MSETYELKAEIRQEVGKKVNNLRNSGKIPAVLYGHGIDSKNIAVEKISFVKVLARAGESSLVDLSIGGDASVKVLIQDLQYHPFTNEVNHIDFRQVRMDEKLETEIELLFVDESPAVKELGGVLVKNLSALQVRCLPSALVHEIKVSLSPLKIFEDKIHVRDIALPDGIEVLNDLDEAIVLIEEPRSEEALKELEATPEAAVEDVKVATEEKKAEREKEKEEGEAV